MFDRNSDKFASALLFFSAAFWGLYWLPLREMGQAGLSATWSVAFFNFCPLLVLVPYVLLKREEQLRHMKAVTLVALMTGVGLACYATGLVMSSVIRATLLFYLTPIWSTIIGVIWLRERLSVGRIVAIALGLLGLYLLISSGDAESVPLNIGDIFAVLSGVFWAVGAAGIKRWPEVPTSVTSTGQFVFACLASAAFGIFYFGEEVPELGAFVSAFPVGFFAGTFVLLPTLYAIFWASKRLFPGRVGLLMMSEALVAILSASLLLPEEVLSFWQWTGGFIVIAACLVEILSKDEAEPLPST